MNPNLKDDVELSSIKMSPLLFYAISSFLIVGMVGCCIMNGTKKRPYVTDVTHRYPTATGWTIENSFNNNIMLHVYIDDKIIATFKSFILVQDYEIKEKYK